MSLGSIISIKNIDYTYSSDTIKTLDNLSLDIQKGSFTAILGRNGSGKSTLAKHMNAILVPDVGTVSVCGYDTKDENNTILIRERVGMVFQNPDNQIVANVVEDDVAFAPENIGVESSEIRQRVDDALKEVGMYEYRTHAPHLLSGGQKQRVAIAGVLAMNPEIIVLDEPTAMLDPQGRKEVISTITSLCREKRITVVLITHHMEECIEADRVVVVDEGKIALEGSPLEVFSQVDKMEKLGLAVPETAKTLFELNLPIKSLSIEDTAKEILNG